MKLIVSIFTLLFSLSVTATPLDKMVVFGDSLSDNGNLYEYMKHQIPLSPPYYEGRFTNGPVWVELLMQKYYPRHWESSLLDYAFGGAGVAGEGMEDEDDTLFTLRQEIDSYLLAHADKADENSLYVVWMGSNNYLAIPDEPEKAVDDVIWGIKNNIERLIAKGAKHIMVINLPDLGVIPAARDFDAIDILSYCSKRHNELLVKTVDQLQANYPEVQWVYYDVNELLNDMLANPANYGYTNVNDTCYEEMINHPSSKSILNLVSSVKLAAKKDACTGYMFFDPVHPAEPAHVVMADKIYNLLTEKGITFTQRPSI